MLTARSLAPSLFSCLFLFYFCELELFSYLTFNVACCLPSFFFLILLKPHPSPFCFVDILFCFYGRGSEQLRYEKTNFEAQFPFFSFSFS